MRILSAFFLLVGGVVLAAPAPKEVKVPDYFPVIEGSTWNYQQTNATKGQAGKPQKISVGLTKVTVEKDVTKAVFTTELPGGAKRTEEFEINAKEIVVKQSTDIGSDLVVYKKGAKVGDKWSGKVFLGKVREGTCESVVEEPQEITLGEKKYKCVVVSHQMSFEVKGAVGGANPGVNQLGMTVKLWFAPDIGIVKREVSLSIGPVQAIATIQELEEYTPKK